MRKIREAGHKLKRTTLDDERVTSIEITPKASKRTFSQWSITSNALNLYL